MKSPLDKIVGVQELSQKWGCTPDYVKQMCEQDRIPCKKIGKTWVVLADQDKPIQSKKEKP